MSSTEQKNVTQHFIANCFTFGILATIKAGRFADFHLDTDNEPFQGLGPTRCLQKRLEQDPDRIALSRRLMPILRDAPISTRCAPMLLYLSSAGNVTSGNLGIMRFIAKYYRGCFGIDLPATGAARHAKKHTRYIHAMLAPGSYGRIERAARNATAVSYKHRAEKYRAASDAIEYISRGAAPHRYAREVRSWCSEARDALGISSSYYRTKDAYADYANIDKAKILSLNEPPSIAKPGIKCAKSKGYGCDVYKQGSTTFIRIYKWKYDYSETPDYGGSQETILDGGKTYYVSKYKGDSETFVFNRRDLDDIRYLLHAAALYNTYINRRATDIRDRAERAEFRRLADDLWGHYVDVVESCGRSFAVRNKCGVYFDVLQWRYLAWRSGDEFYDHSTIMRNKLESKGLTSLPSQEFILARLKNAHMDVAVDLLGIYKASIYPEVDPFKVVTDQRALHYSRHQTGWDPESPEGVRFEQTRAYMWYLGIRVIKSILKFWPGKIREGVEPKQWHRQYAGHGIPGGSWREACDIDLTGCLPQSDISGEQYMRQADSACAPVNPWNFKDFWSMRDAPRRHKRKLLFAIQEPDPPDLVTSLKELNSIGSKIPTGYVGPVHHSLKFSTDIVTGARCERHKDAPRPFYAASSPWGCILSYFDGITRDFLAKVPQCMLGKSNRQKFLDISTASNLPIGNNRYFYVSDDKAKYSPRMDPESQQLPAEFFGEVFGIPAFRAYGPIMYHCDLYYRVCGHLVSYNSNGTDREGMRGASNTWLEIVAQGLATRLSREKGLTTGKSIFLSFIDDGLRRFQIPAQGKNDQQIRESAREVLDEVIFGLRVLGRELSWDKTFVSSDLYVILNEVIYEGSHFSSGLKSYVTVGDLELKEVMTAADYEQLYFGKLKGALGVGAPLDLCHVTYVYETILSHYKMGLRMQDNKHINAIDYRLYCITPLSLGGAGLRSMTQMICTENANSTKEGMGNLVRLCQNFGLLKHCLQHLLSQELEKVKPVDFMREPEQFHVVGPRIVTQRLAAVVRTQLSNTACNEISRSYMNQDRDGMRMLESMGTVLMATGDVSAAEVRLLYSMSPVCFIDEFIQKLASSATISQLLPKETIRSLRSGARKDLIMSSNVFAVRCKSCDVIKALRMEANLWVACSKWFV